MASFASLPDDCLGLILSFLGPPKQCTIFDPPITHNKKKIYPNYLQTIDSLDDHSITFERYYDALEDIIHFASLDSYCRIEKNRFIPYNPRHIQQSIIQYLKYIYCDNIRLPSYIDCTHSNSGCLQCKQYLPYWWPNIDNPDNAMSSDKVEKWCYLTQEYIRFGLCSKQCFNQYTKEMYIVGGLICCKRCHHLYTFADSEYYGKFCSECCQEEYMDELIYTWTQS